ncbi:MAG: DUF927 domain-containing protein [Lachnospiraceae bacterium]
MFREIFETEDEIERTRYIEDARRACKAVRRGSEFDNLLKAYGKLYGKLNHGEVLNTTNFPEGQIELSCGKYTTSDFGVSLTDVNSMGQTNTRTICSHPILPVERLINIDTDTEKLKIAFYRDYRWRSVVASCGTVFNKSYISMLADRGVIVTSESAKDLVKYLADMVSYNMQEIPISRSISRLGWTDDGRFIPYVDDIKYDGDTDFQSIYDCIGEKGSFSDWLEHILDIRKNLYVRLALDASLGSVLLDKVGALSFLFHLWGTTGFGKTVTEMVAASCWGNPEMGKMTRTVNMTTNAMMRNAAFFKHLPLILDELQQIKDKWGGYDDWIMKITEGIDRGRAKAYGGIEEVKTWLLIIITTGEEMLTRSHSGGGARNRCVEIEVDGKIIEDGNKTANIVKENYGFAGKRFVEYIQSKDVEEIRKDFRKIMREILRKVDTTDKQAMNFAVLLLSDRYACECLFGGESLTVDDIKPFLISKKEVNISERAYEFVLDWIAQNTIRFNSDTDTNKGEVWGKIEDEFVMVNKTVLVSAMSREGFEFDACKKDWAEKGKLEKNPQGKFHHVRKIGEIKAMYIKIMLPEDDFIRVNELSKQEQMRLPFD